MSAARVATIFIVSALAVGLWLSDVHPAAACTPPPGGLPEHSACDRYRHADVVILGVIDSVEEPDRPPYAAQITVEEYLKATGPMTVTISGFGPSGLCLSEVHAGERWILLADGDPESDPNLVASYLSQFDAALPPHEATVAEMRSGCAATVTPTASATATSPPPSTLTATATAGTPISQPVWQLWIPYAASGR